jgi:hypothetical protein
MLQLVATFSFGQWVDSTNYIHWKPLSLSKTFLRASDGCGSRAKCCPQPQIIYDVAFRSPRDTIIITRLLTPSMAKPRYNAETIIKTYELFI